MKKLASLLLALSLIFGLVSFSYAEEPYEVVIETVTFGAEYADIPAIEEAINAITVPAINVSVKILNVGIPEHAQKISMMERDLSRVFSAKHSTNSKRELTD